MVKTPSTMLALGTPAPNFELPDVVSGATLSMRSIANGQPMLVMFICAHCPFVIHLEHELAAIGKEYGPKGLSLVAISSNSVQTHPQDAPELLKAQAETCGFTFPYLYDESQDTAKSYTAACTPDFFLFDRDGALAYRGQLDDSRPGTDIPVTGADIRAAIEALLANKRPAETQHPSLGCNIKWTPGNEPSYFGS